MHVETSLSRDELAPKLESWTPWRHLINFSNGLSTGDFETTQPFNRQPIAKIRLLEDKMDWSAVDGGRALDIGFNCGYNTIHLAAEHDMTVTGIDVNPRHLEVATFLSEVAGVTDRVDFRLDDATTFCEEGSFDLVLHLGTLYHLPNPYLALQTAARNLKPGGKLALETQTYVGEDQTLSKMIHGDKGDFTNWWSLSRRAVFVMLEHVGFAEAELVFEAGNEWISDDQARSVFVATKPL